MAYAAWLRAEPLGPKRSASPCTAARTHRQHQTACNYTELHGIGGSPCLPPRLRLCLGVRVLA